MENNTMKVYHFQGKPMDFCSFWYVYWGHVVCWEAERWFPGPVFTRMLLDRSSGFS